MTGRRYVYLTLIYALCLTVTGAVRVGNVLIQSVFSQTRLPSSEYSFQYDDDEIFNVDFDKRMARWRLPQFGDLSGFDPAHILVIKSVNDQNLQLDMKRRNYTAAIPVTPIIHVFTEDPVVLNEPNTLICFIKQIFPPVIKMSWLKNTQPVTEGVSDTDYYFTSDMSYYKFSYLATIPAEGDVYTCSVEHAGLPVNPTNRMWSPEIPSHMSETSEDLVCGLGLAVGIIGVIAGILLFLIKRKKNNRNGGH
ncbi:H-2 class II histocompatibility antigen, A-U alpha chain-like [Leptodactylus fuscus]|uniref:H-2 class II histocompatibility antigen, A-U alpha chain-like n=1 Tax=Leptodactylus fuscus TaxID=238119 RepID=UPI003F4F0D38